MSSRVLPFINTVRLVAMHMNGYTPQGGGPAVPRALEAPYRAATMLPMPLEPALPLVQVIAGTSSQDNQHTAFPRVDVYNFAATEDAVWKLTRASNEAMRSLGEAEVDGQSIDVVVPIMRPYYLAWSPTVHRTIGTYEIQLRPRSA